MTPPTNTPPLPNGGPNATPLSVLLNDPRAVADLFTILDVIQKAAPVIIAGIATIADMIRQFRQLVPPTPGATGSAV